jgi:heat shock protein HtpX
VQTPPSATLHGVWNLAKVTFLIGAFALPLGGVMWWLGGLPVGALGLAIGLIAGATLLVLGDRIVLGLLEAEELPPDNVPGLTQAVYQLAETMGVRVNDLYLIEDDHPRTFALGGPRHATVVVTTGFLAMASMDELEGLLAHELAHARHRDTLMQTSVVVIAATILELARFGGPLRKVMLYFLGPLAGSIVQLFISPNREFAADLVADLACTTPNVVVTGLERLDRASELVTFSANPATEPLYTLDPFDDDGLAGWFSTHPPLSDRLLRLGRRAAVHSESASETNT